MTRPLKSVFAIGRVEFFALRYISLPSLVDKFPYLSSTPICLTHADVGQLKGKIAISALASAHGGHWKKLSQVPCP
jgi:hypothetical protein